MDDMMSLTPAGHRVIVKIEKPDEMTASKLIYIPVQAREARSAVGQVGTLVAIGPQAWKAFVDGVPWAEVGDKVFCVKHAGVVFEDSSNLRLMNDEDILIHEKDPPPGWPYIDAVEEHLKTPEGKDWLQSRIGTWNHFLNTEFGVKMLMFHKLI